MLKNFIEPKILKYDLIISSGGSSFSSGDHTSSYLIKNTKILFQYLRIQPGRPIIFAKQKRQYIFSLPGNPLAVMVNLKLIISIFLTQIIFIQILNLKTINRVLIQIKKELI